MQGRADLAYGTSCHLAYDAFISLTSPPPPKGRTMLWARSFFNYRVHGPAFGPLLAQTIALLLVAVNIFFFNNAKILHHEFRNFSGLRQG